MHHLPQTASPPGGDRELRRWHIKTKTETRRIRFPAPRPEDGDDVIEFVLDEEEEAPCSEYIVMSQERELPALREYLRASCSREF